MVTGFLTVEGAKVLLPALHSSPSKLKTLVVGAGTYRGFEALDELLSNGVSRDCLHIHLGYTRPTTSAKAKHSFYRYHPMLHSKVSLFEMANGEAVAFCKKALLARSFCCFTFFGPKTQSFLASHALFSCFTCPRFLLHLPTCLASHPLVCCFCCLLACSLWSSHSPTSCFTCSHILLHMLLNLASHGLMCFFTC